MTEFPVTEAIAEYRGRRLPIVFGGDDWVALRVAPGADVPDGFASGDSPVGLGRNEPWVKVPRSALDGVTDVRVSALLDGQQVTVQRRLPDGRVGVEFIGPPAVARGLGLSGDQYMGWTGLVDPTQLRGLRVEETRRENHLAIPTEPAPAKSPTDRAEIIDPATHFEVYDVALSAAVVAAIKHTAMPHVDRGNLLAVYGEHEGERLAGVVLGLVGEASEVPIEWDDMTLAAGLNQVMSQFRKTHPELTRDALREIGRCVGWGQRNG